MLVAVASVKGSPGVTTFALALAAGWPGDARRVLVECDPAGGDLAARFVLSLSPGLISLAAGARRGGDVELLWRHAQRLPGGLAVVAAPPSPDRTRTALATLHAADGGGVLAATGGRADLVAVLDCGRLGSLDVGAPGDPSPLGALVGAADRLLVLVRPQRDELAHLAARAEELAGPARRLEVLLAGPGYPPAEVVAELGLAVVASVPDDPRSAARLTGRPAPRGWSRARLPRAAERIAATVWRDHLDGRAEPGRVDTTPTPVHPDDAGARAGRLPARLLTGAGGRPS